MKREKFVEMPLEGLSLYRISNYGRVLNIKTGKFVKPISDKDGYQTMNAYPNGKHKALKIHRLVGMAFIKNPAGKPFINHKDGNKANNYVGNLEWVTQLENAQHAAKIGLCSRGERCNLSTLKEVTVRAIKKSLKNKVPPILIAAQYGVTRNAVYQIKNNKSWKHVIIT